jgi:polynucleotide 5'-kinase involved in rRNA processing
MRGLTVVEVEGALVGLDDAHGRTLGLGWVTALDMTKARLTVDTRVDGRAIAAVAIGRESYRAA